MRVSIVKYTVDKLKRSLAIVQDGDTATRNIAKDKFVNWKGNIYTANQAISSGTTLSAASGGNLTACDDGALNELERTKTKIITIDGTSSGYDPSQQGFWDYIYARIPYPYDGTVIALYQEVHLTCVATKINANYGSMSINQSGKTAPYFYGHSETGVLFDHYALNSETVKITTIHDRWTETAHGAGSVSYNLSGYTYVMVTFKDNDQEQYRKTQVVLIGEKTRLINNDNRVREFEATTTGCTWGTSNYPDFPNTRCVICKIMAVKFP